MDPLGAHSATVGWDPGPRVQERLNALFKRYRAGVGAWLEPIVREYNPFMLEGEQDEYRKMLELSARKSMGAVPYNVTPRHTAIAKKILGPNKVLAVEQKVTIETDPAKARALGRKELSRYMVMENYRNNWLREGFSESDLAGGGSDKFIDAMCLWGDADTVRRGLRRHFEAGATHVCLQPVHEEGNTAARDKIIETLADV